MSAYARARINRAYFLHKCVSLHNGEGAAEKAIHLDLAPDERHGMLDCQDNCTVGKFSAKKSMYANRRLAGARFYYTSSLNCAETRL